MGKIAFICVVALGAATAAPAAAAGSDGACTRAERGAAPAMRELACPPSHGGDLTGAALCLALLGCAVVAGGQASKRKSDRLVFS